MNWKLLIGFILLPPEKLDDKLPDDICAIRLGFEKPEFMRADFEKLVHLLRKDDHAGEIVDFYDGYTEYLERFHGMPYGGVYAYPYPDPYPQES